MKIDIHPIDWPSSTDAPLSPLVTAYCEVDRAQIVHHFGNDDLVEPAESIQISRVDTRDSLTKTWVAFPAGTAVATEPGDAPTTGALAMAEVVYPVSDNTHLAYLWVVVHPDHRRQGIGVQLYDLAARELATSGRTTLQTWSDHHPYEGADGLMAKSGVGTLGPDDPYARWIAARGFTLEQTESHSILTIPAESDDAASWWARVDSIREQAASRAGSGYRAVQWSGATPVEWRGNYAELRARMSVDIPSAGMDSKEEKWDADRVARRDERFAKKGMESAFSAILHVPSGRLVAYTEVVWPKHRPSGVWQEDTFVHGEHRGRRLGALVKTLNLELLRQKNPEAQRIHTWNAGENNYMLAINHELGFEPHAVGAGWQKKLD